MHDVDKDAGSRDSPVPNRPDIPSATTDLQMPMNSGTSRYNVFRQVYVGTTTTPTSSVTSPGVGLFSYDPSGTTTKQVYIHNLGYVPAVIGYITVGGGPEYLPLPYTVYNTGVGSGAASWTTWSIYADSSAIWINTSIMVYGMAQSQSALPVKFYLYQQSAT